MVADYVVNQIESGITAVNLPARSAVTGDVGRAVAALRDKLAQYDLFWAYYDGNHPQVYTNKRLAEIFRDIDINFSENWCAVVVDVLDDRVNLESVRVDDAYQALMDSLWARLGLKIEADDCHQAAMVCGESFLIVWPDADGHPDAYFNDPRLCHVFYDSASPRVKRYAAKWWHDDVEDVMRLTLYYPERIEYYVADKAGRLVVDDTKWRLLETAVNEYNTVPVFHFRATRRQKSDLKDAVPIQIGINKLVNDMMVSAEYGAFKQRWVISQSDVLDNLKNAPNEIWHLPAGDGMGQSTQAGEFQGADLMAYVRGIDHFAGALAAVTRTPKHFFFKTSANVSGEALLTMEAPLTRKASKRILLFSPEWRSALAFLLRTAGVTVARVDIDLIFEPVASLQPLTLAEVRVENKAAGIPLTTQLRLEGWSDDELAQLVTDRQVEQAAEFEGMVIGE